MCREGIQHVMMKCGVGNAAAIVVGGAEESLEAHPGTYNVKIKHRKGFVKMALQTGYVMTY